MSTPKIVQCADCPDFFVCVEHMACIEQPAPVSATEPDGGFWSAGDPQYIALLGLRAMKGITDARAADCHRKASHSQEFSGGIDPMLARAYELDRQSSHLAVAIDAIEQNPTLRARVAELERVTEAEAEYRTCAEKIAHETFAHWDADRHSKVGKYVMALGGMTGIRVDLDKARAALTAARGGG